jgi:pyridoxamine 5'-phosphate oxidase
MDEERQGRDLEPGGAAAADMRQSYERFVLVESEADPDPFAQFRQWFDQAVAEPMYEPNAVALATVGEDGRPGLRMVLMKDFDAAGFVFYSNLESRKGRELAANPEAALMFWWDRLHRQVRVEGRAEPVADAEADAYFASRPHGSRIGAWASPQSAVIPDRAGLEAREAEFRARFPEDAGPGPAPAALVRLAGRPGALRVLAGPPQQAARPPRLRPERFRMADRAPGAVMV